MMLFSFTTSNGSAGVADFTAQSAQSYTILAGETTVNIPVEILGDNIAESTESFTAAITISNANSQQVTIGTGSATATINDDDAYTISISDITVSESDVNANHNFVATMSGEAQDDVVISFTTSNGSAGVADFTAQSNQLYTIPAGSTSVNIPVEIIGDLTVESSESFNVVIIINELNNQQISILDGVAVGIINDNDASEVSIAATTQASEPGTDGLFTLNLTNEVSVDTEITFAVSGIATEGTDYSAIGTTVTILANTKTATIPVSVIDDDLVETAGETVVVTLSSTNTAVTVSTTDEASVTISDDDSSEISIAATDDTAQENTPAINNAEFTVSMSKASSVQTVVSYTVNGTATDGSDFTSLSGSVTIPATSKTAKINVVIIDDLLFENSETVIITLTGISSGDVSTVLGTAVSATATIIDNDIDCYAGTDTEICSSDVSYTLSSATQNNATTYLWTTNGSGTFTDANILNAVYNPSNDDRVNGEVELTLSVSGISGNDSDVMTLKIWPAVVIDAGVESAIINEGETYTVSGATAENYSTITWTSLGGTFDNPNGLNPVFTPSTKNSNVVIRMTATGLGTAACSDAYDEISITINDFPTASNESITGFEDQELSFTESNFSSNYTDDNAFAGIKIVNNTSVGNLEYNGLPVSSGLEIASGDISKLKFKSLLNENGLSYDSFEFKVFDGSVYSSDTYTMNISITAVNDEPSFSLANPKDILVSEDIGTVVINGQVVTQLSGPSDEVGQTLTLHVTNNNSALFSAQPTLDASGNLTFTTANNAFGIATLSVYISDDGGVANSGVNTSQVQTFDITVEAVNDSPVAEDDLFTIDEDSQMSGDVKLDNGNGADYDNDNTSDNFTYTIVNVGLAESNGTLVFNTNGTFTYSPNSNFFGIVSFSYRVCDNPIAPLIQQCDEASVTITVNQISDTPLAVDDNLWLKENSSINGNVFDNDQQLVDTPVIIFSNTTPTHGTLVINTDGSFTYTPNTDYFGNDSFEYTLKDIDGDESTATVYIVIDALDYNPIANNDFFTINEDQIGTGDLFANDQDFINNPVVVISNTNPDYGSVVVNANGTFTYTPNADFYGTDTFTYTLQDSDGDTDSATVTITVNSVNDIPVAVNDTNTTTEDTAVVGNVLLNDTNLGDKPVSVVLFTNPANGVVSIDSDGTYTYSPKSNFYGTDSFTYTIEDENGDTSTATVTIVINSVHDAPVANNDQVATLDNQQIIIPVLDNDEDADGDKLLIYILDGPSYGEVIVNQDGTLSYIANLGSYCNTDKFTYKICDNLGLCDTAEVTIDIGVNDSDDDSIPDAIETLTLNTDLDRAPNYQDLDSDNDGISDSEEANIFDHCSDIPVDTDGDGIPNYLDTDSDNDGVTDKIEGNDDCDDDGIPNYLDSYDDCAEYISVPEGFSPNGDGINDFFVIKGIKDFPNSQLIVFNRWGAKIFQAKAYQNNWDGRSENSLTVGSDIIPEGTYFYIIDLGNGTDVIKGFVYINY